MKLTDRSLECAYKGNNVYIERKRDVIKTMGKEQIIYNYWKKGDIKTKDIAKNFT